MTDPTRRFSDRVEDYVRYRPDYPAAAVDHLARECGLGRDSAVADIGAGTGIWTRRLLELGCRVFAVEPNRAMLHAASSQLRFAERLALVSGTAEATGLPDEAVDLVTVAQAFHWFDRRLARAEMARILRPGGWVAILWNERRKASTPFLAAYERLLRAWATDYEQVDHSRIGRSDMELFFAPERLREARFDNRQQLDLTGLEGRLRSSSYAPAEGHPDHQPMMTDAARIFAAHQRDGRVAIDYDTRVYYGRLRREATATR